MVLKGESELKRLQSQKQIQIVSMVLFKRDHAQLTERKRESSTVRNLAQRHLCFSGIIPDMGQIIRNWAELGFYSPKSRFLVANAT